MSSAAQTDGFTKDCLQLLTNFRGNKGLDFSNFCEEWKAMNFHYIFCGFRNDVEMIFNINEYFCTLKGMFVSSQSLVDKVGILFLMYAIYYKQPPKEYCKIRVTIDEWKVFKEFYEKLHAHDEFNKIKLIFWTMLKSGAFVFVEAERKYTFDYFTRNEYDDESIKIDPNLFRHYYQRYEANLNNPERGMLPALKFLEDAYNEMKDLLENQDHTEKSLPNTLIVSELSSGFKKIANIFDIEPTEEEINEGAGDSTDSDDLREQVETSIKQRRDVIKRRALTKDMIIPKKEDDLDDSDSDEDDKSIINLNKSVGASVVTNEKSLTISFGKRGRYKPKDAQTSTYTKMLDSIGKVAANELQEQPKVELLPVTTVQPSLDIIL